MNYMIVNGELYHYGIKGQKWGLRRWQNDDGSFNEAGKARYFSRGGGENYHKLGKRKSGSSGVSGGLGNKIAAKVYETNEKYYSKHGNKAMASANKRAKEAQMQKYNQKNTPEARAKRAANLKKAAKIGAIAAGTALAAYGAYKLHESGKDKELIDAAKLYMNKASTKAKMAGYEALGRADNAVQGARRAANKVSGKARNAVTKAKIEAELGSYRVLGDRGYNNAKNTVRSVRKSVSIASTAARNAGQRATSAVGRTARSATTKAKMAGYEALGRADNATQTAKRAINAYKKEHPLTRLSDQKILKALGRR